MDSHSTADLRTRPRPAKVTWQFVSGFFDGEGGIVINYGTERRVLHVEMSMAQKSREVLDLIAEFLKRNGIHSIIGRMNDGTYHLRICRAGDVIRMATKMKLIVKGSQIQAASDYLMGKLTGNQFLAILQNEHLLGRRKTNIPADALVRFPLTRFEAKKLAQENASVAGSSANKERMHVRVIEAFRILPNSFTSTELMNQLRIGRIAALHRGRYLEKLGLVSTRRVKRKGRPWVLFTKILHTTSV